MWAYEVSGKQVLCTPSATAGVIVPARLSAIAARRRRSTKSNRTLLPEYTSDLLNLLHVLGRLIALEPRQAELLQRICAGKLRKADELREAGALAHPRGETAFPGRARRKARADF